MGPKPVVSKQLAGGKRSATTGTIVTKIHPGGMAESTIKYRHETNPQPTYFGFPPRSSAAPSPLRLRRENRAPGAWPSAWLTGLMAPVGLLKGFLVLRHLLLFGQLGSRFCRRHLQHLVAQGTGLFLLRRGFLELRFTTTGVTLHINHGQKGCPKAPPRQPLGRRIIDLPTTGVESPLFLP